MPAPKLSNVIKVPKPSKAAYNPDRPLEKNLLIKAQVEHFREAESRLPLELQTGINVGAGEDGRTSGRLHTPGHPSPS